MQAYRDINTRHFAGALPEVAVRWEPALAGVGALATPPFTQQGVFGHVGKHLIILLNPSVQADPRAQARALSHEMVHVYFYSVGDTSTNHGPAFQAVLQRLSAEGAFEGIAASDSDKASLRDWLDAESARLDHEREAIDALSGEIATGRAGLDREVAALNARITAANAEGRGWPEAAEVSDLEARRARFNERLADSNARIERDRDDLAHFNEEVARYNLMMSYPDGLDEESLMRSKPAPPPAGGPLGRR
jgi:hypothetical protein